MLVSAKPNNHVDQPQKTDVNHSVSALLSNTFASSTTVKVMVLMLNKFNKTHAQVLMELNH
jgi:hypothetical protein